MDEYRKLIAFDDRELQEARERCNATYFYQQAMYERLAKAAMCSQTQTIVVPAENLSQDFLNLMRKDNLAINRKHINLDF